MTPPAIASEQDAGERYLQNHRRELDEQGYTVVPPEVTGVDGSMVDALTERLLEKCELLIGCKFTVEHGPERELDYGEFRGFLERISNATPSQFQLMQLCTYHRVFRDLAVNPVATSLIDHLFGTTGSHRVARFSSHNCFVKWAGDGYGESLGLHADQAGIPRPWGDKALNANCNWCLTDYTLRDGAFACVPGSHRKKSLPNLPDCVQDAIPIECPRGSVIVFHGALWHGAYPRTTPGLRLTLAYFYRHMAILPQDDIPGRFPRELAQDCADPALFTQLAGFGSPYRSQVYPLPRAIQEEQAAAAG